MDLGSIFSFERPLEVFVRGTALYWFLFLIFRVLMRRDVGSVTIADALLLVLIADASQNAMAGEYNTVSDGFVLVATIVGWNMLIDWLTFRFTWLRKLLEPQPLLLIQEGRIVHRHLRQEFLTVDDVMGKLREQGIEQLSDVKKAYMESDGEFSVIKVKGAKA
ncbi:MAG: DUF421 domain-containing protein [Rubrivivax sp.]|nr:MAG: DUF421 domain-containing protein [Rubrivivax sp.]